ncbi:CotH kinase family protein [Streptomyces hoynatensis]|uniref:Spore coat protein CotH n=1 Tax=Streptomyces hoynatensis TaxID=1141874 RepID=A0A3A9ZF41_9ACTN|nr:CotH kinase family protein [Streptomyces hoynatensis]RKN46923.1 spore coat protein CotH [Streptomyces hoynatensis]
MGALRRRLPVRVRQNWRPVSALVAGLGVLLVFFGSSRVSPWVTSASDGEGEQIVENISGAVDLYDRSVAHSIRLDYDEDDYAEMMEDFQEDGEKNSIEADLTLDGTFIESVGLRLKGNSTLQSLRTGDSAPGGGRAPAEGGAGPDQEQTQEGQEGQEAQEGQGEGAGEVQRGFGGGGFGGMVQLSPDKPEELPWLISIDEYVEGRAYQGHQEISVRPGSDGQVPLNEAVSLSLMDASDQPAERFAFSSFAVNDRPTTTRLVVENPGPSYGEATVGTNGVLYKARAGSRFAYQGEDPTAYEDDFNQLTKKGSQDLQPVIDLIKWAEEATDEEFAAELSAHVDVSSFADYVATQNLLLNNDDMAGPGRNYLLWYDLDTGRFSVLGWDFNLTFSGDPALGPEESTSMGGGMGPGGGALDGADQGTQDGADQGAQDGVAEGAQPAPGEGQAPPDAQGQDAAGAGEPPQLPEGFPAGGPANGAGGFPAPGVQEGGTDGGGDGATNGGGDGGAAGDEGARGGPGGAGGGMTASNTLKDRFLELDAFDEVYADAYRDLYQRFYASGTAVDLLDTLAGQAADAGAGGSELDAAVEQLRGTLTERAEALAGEELIGG